MCGFFLFIILSITGAFFFLLQLRPSEEERNASNLIYLNSHMPEELKNVNQQDAQELYRLAYYYLYGQGCISHPVEAFRIMHKSAQLGHVGACYRLGFMYEAGLGTDVDLDKAQLYYQKSLPDHAPDTIAEIQILNFIKTDKNEPMTPTRFEITPEIEKYYIELLAQSYEALAYWLDPPIGYVLNIAQNEQYRIKYSLFSTDLPKELTPYIDEWKKAAEEIVKLQNGDKSLDYKDTWNKGIAATQDCDERYPEIAALLSFKHAQNYINNKYKIEENLPQLKQKLSGISHTCPEVCQFQATFLRNLAHYLRKKCKLGIL